MKKRIDASKPGVFGSLLLKFCTNPGLCSIILGAAWDKCGFTQNQNGKVYVFSLSTDLPCPYVETLFNEQIKKASLTSDEAKPCRGPELSAPAFDSHFKQLKAHYGSQVSTSKLVD